jgi:tetratricopeptide (TPR) repeat protein
MTRRDARKRPSGFGPVWGWTGIALLLLAISSGIAEESAGGEIPQIHRLRIVADSLGTRIQIAFSGDIETLELTDPPRWAVDLSPALLDLAPRPAFLQEEVDLGALQAVRVAQYQPEPEPVVRITLVLREPRPLSIVRQGRTTVLQLRPGPGDRSGELVLPRGPNAQGAREGALRARRLRPLQEPEPVRERALRRVLLEAQEAVLADRPDRAMDRLALGMRLYPETPGVDAARLFWQLLVPLTSRPLLVSLFPEPEEDAEAWLQETTYDRLLQVAMQIGDVRHAGRILEAWARGHLGSPHWAQRTLEFVDLLLLRGRNDPAARWIDRIPEGDLDEGLRARVRLQRARVLLARGETGAARDLLERLARETSGRARQEARLLLADTLFRTEDVASALEHYLAVAREGTDPGKRSWALYRAGVCQERLEAWDAARQSFRDVVSSYPDSPWASLAQEHLECLGLLDLASGTGS